MPAWAWGMVYGLVAIVLPVLAMIWAIGKGQLGVMWLVVVGALAVALLAGALGAPPLLEARGFDVGWAGVGAILSLVALRLAGPVI